MVFDGGASAERAFDHIARSPIFGWLGCELLCAGPDRPKSRKTSHNAATLPRARGFAIGTDIEPRQADVVIVRQTGA